jgi:hypothetical protein
MDLFGRKTEGSSATLSRRKGASRPLDPCLPPPFRPAVGSKTLCKGRVVPFLRGRKQQPTLLSAPKATSVAGSVGGRSEWSYILTKRRVQVNYIFAAFFYIYNNSGDRVDYKLHMDGEEKPKTFNNILTLIRRERAEQGL